MAKKKEVAAGEQSDQVENLLSDIHPNQIHLLRKAKEALAKDPKAPKAIILDITPYAHQEFPKHLYKGEEEKIVGSATEESAAREEGFALASEV